MEKTLVTQQRHKKHILIVVRHPVGGIRTFFRYVLTQFDNAQYKFTFVLPATSEFLALKENLKEIDCTFIVRDNKDGAFPYMKSIAELLKNNDVDLVYSHGFTSMVYSFLPVCLFRKPHLFTSHDVLMPKQFAGFTGAIKKKVLGVCLHCVDIIHSVSNDAQENLLSYFPGLSRHPARLVVISNGIEVDRFLIEEREDWRQTLGLNDRTFLVGFFGRFMAQKGFNYLIEAMEILSKQDLDCKPLVLSFGWGGYIREEQSLIKAKGLTSFFRFMPFQENPARAMRGVDVIVMPSLWEACPLQPMEALIAGVPVIATNCLGLREVLEDTPARVVSTRDSNALAGAIRTEMATSSQYEVEKFRRKAADRFDVTSQSHNLELLITKLCSIVK